MIVRHRAVHVNPVLSDVGDAGALRRKAKRWLLRKQERNLKMRNVTQPRVAVAQWLGVHLIAEAADLG